MPVSAVAALERDRLLGELLGTIELAAERVWASYFLVGLEARDRRGSVRYVLDALARATLRGVDVRVLMDDFESGVENFRPNVVAATYLARRRVGVRIYRNERRRSSHSKFLLADASRVLLGSGNLTPGGLDNNHELALDVHSPDLVRHLADRFTLGWQEGTPWPAT
jgi:phosphatidylserine/phosphatidylglycerophosphate/cardiolipin synthase-like enzyme